MFFMFFVHSEFFGRFCALQVLLVIVIIMEILVVYSEFLCVPKFVSFMQKSSVMDPYQRIWKQLEYAQRDFHDMAPGWACEKLDRADLEYDLQEALRGLEYSNGLLQNLRQLQSKSSLSDVTIKVDGKVFHAHRSILAAASPYFETMFTSGFQESSRKEIELKDMDGNIFEKLFNFIYSGKMDLSLDTAIEAYHAGHYLQLCHLESSFSDFFVEALQNKKLTAEYALSVLKIAGEGHMHSLFDKCNDYLIKIFPEAMQVDNFVENAFFPLVDKGLSKYLSILNVRAGVTELEVSVLSWSIVNESKIFKMQLSNCSFILYYSIHSFCVFRRIFST